MRSSVAFYTSGGSEIWLTEIYEVESNFELLLNGSSLTYSDDYDVDKPYNVRVRLTNDMYGEIKNNDTLTINIKHRIAEFQFFDPLETATVAYDGGSTHREYSKAVPVDENFTVNTDATADDAMVTFTLNDTYSRPKSKIFLGIQPNMDVADFPSNVLNTEGYEGWASYDETTHIITVNVGYIHLSFGDIHHIRIALNSLKIYQRLTAL